MLNRNLRLVDARGDGHRSNRRHRSSRHCMRRDSIRYSSRRIRGRTLQTHVGEIPSVKSSHAASVSTATTSVTTTTTSECRSWLSQADRCRCEQGYSRFPHHASSPGRGRSQGGDTFAAGFIRWSKNARSKLTVSITAASSSAREVMLRSLRTTCMASATGALGPSPIPNSTGVPCRCPWARSWAAGPASTRIRPATVIFRYSVNAST